MQEWIGQRIARYRDLAGLTQQQLADRVDVDRTYITKIESGAKTVRTRDLLIKLADALGVSTADLTGSPRVTRDPAERAVHVAVPLIRAALDGALDLGSVVHGDQVQRDAAALMQARMACDYGRLGALLPATIGGATEIAEAAPMNSEAHHLVARVLFTASMVLRPLGYLDLATRMADAAQLAGATSGRDDAMAAAAFARSQCLLAGGVQGMRAASLRLAEGAADALDRNGLDDPADTAWYGLLHLQSALAAATLGKDQTAEMHIGEAADFARREPADTWLMDFNLANVRVWELAAALEGGDPGRAPDLARLINPHDLATVQRRSHLLIHTGLGYFARDDYAGATRSFRLADALAPAEVRGRSRVREAVGQMLRDARRVAGTEELRDLARKVGVDPLEE